MSGWGRGRASDWTLPLGRKTARTTTAEGPTCHCPPKESGVEPPDAYGSSRRKFPAQRERPRSKQEVSVVSPLLRVLMCVGGTGGGRDTVRFSWSLPVVSVGETLESRQNEKRVACRTAVVWLACVCGWRRRGGPPPLPLAREGGRSCQANRRPPSRRRGGESRKRKACYLPAPHAGDGRNHR